MDEKNSTEEDLSEVIETAYLAGYQRAVDTLRAGDGLHGWQADNSRYECDRGEYADWLQSLQTETAVWAVPVIPDGVEAVRDGSGNEWERTSLGWRRTHDGWLEAEAYMIFSYGPLFRVPAERPQ